MEQIWVFSFITGAKKRHKYYDHFWSLRYVRGADWTSVAQRRGQDAGSLGSRKGREMLAAKKEAKFYLERSERARLIERVRTKVRKSAKPQNFQPSRSIVKSGASCSENLLGQVFYFLYQLFR